MKKLGYILLAVIPGILLTGFIFITSQLYQVYLSVGYFSAGGSEDPVELTNYLTSKLQGDGLLTVVIIGQVLAALIAILFIVKKMKGGDIFRRPLNAVKKLNGLAILIAFVGLELVTSFGLMIFFTIFPDAITAYAEMINTSGLAGFTVISTLATVVFAPVCEEIIFRGFTIKILEKTGFKFWIVNFIQAAFFGIYHLNLVQGIYAFVLGLFLGMAYKKCNTIWASVLGHAIYNFAGTYLISFIVGFLGESALSVILPLLVGLALAVGGVMILLKSTDNGETEVI